MKERLLQLLMTAEIRREQISLTIRRRWDFRLWIQRHLPLWVRRERALRKLHYQRPEAPGRRKATRWI